MRTIEHANARTAHEVEAVLGQMRVAGAAARQLGVRVVQCTLDGEWRATVPWQGSRDATEAADRHLRLRLAARQLAAPAGPNADRARRLRAAEAEATINPPALSRRETDHPFWVGFGAPRR